MRKYLYVFGLSLQNVLQRRASLFMDRLGGLAATLALYYFWVSILKGRDSFLGYSRSQMISYALVMNVLRAFVFTGRGWELVADIAHGHLELPAPADPLPRLRVVARPGAQGDPRRGVLDPFAVIGVLQRDGKRKSSFNAWSTLP